MLYDIVLYTVSNGDGLTKAIVAEMADMLNSSEFYSITAAADHVVNCCAMGFITTEAAAKLEYDYDGLCSYIGGILDDLGKDDSPLNYEFEGLKIFIGYGGD